MKQTTVHALDACLPACCCAGTVHALRFEELQQRYAHLPPNALQQLLSQLLERRRAEAPQPAARGLTSLLEPSALSVLSGASSLAAASGKGCPPAWLRPGRLLPSDPHRLLLVRQAGLLRSAQHPAAIQPPPAYARQLAHALTVRGHRYAVYCLAYDRTGRYLVTGSDDRLVKVGMPLLICQQVGGRQPARQEDGLLRGGGRCRVCRHQKGSPAGRPPQGVPLVPCVPAVQGTTGPARGQAVSTTICIHLPTPPAPPPKKKKKRKKNKKNTIHTHTHHHPPRRCGPPPRAFCRPHAGGTTPKSPTCPSLPTTTWLPPPPWTAQSACGSSRWVQACACQEDVTFGGAPAGEGAAGRGQPWPARGACRQHGDASCVGPVVLPMFVGPEPFIGSPCQCHMCLSVPCALCRSTAAGLACRCQCW